jgi:hypothetical protein
VADAVAAGRLESAVTNPVEALEKLKLVEGGRPLQAAVVAFAKEMLPDYPQCGLRMARFRGTAKDEFLDQRQLTGHAFHLKAIRKRITGNHAGSLSFEGYVNAACLVVASGLRRRSMRWMALTWIHVSLEEVNLS